MKKQLFEALTRANAGIALFDADERIIFSNPAWTQMITGLAEEDLLFNETMLDDGFMLSVCLVRPFDHTAQNGKPSADIPDTAFRNAGTVIIADDSASNRMVARRILQAEGYAILEAVDGQAVLDMLASGVEADLILMDVEMPDMDGLHTTRRIRHLAGPTARIPIIALSAHQSRDWAMVARQSGVNDFISKPINRAGLLDAINNLPPCRPAPVDRQASMAPPPTLRARNTPPIPRHRAPRHVALPTSPVLDTRTLDQLYLDAGAEGASCGIDLFISETESRLVSIDNALSRADLVAVRDEIHILKSTSGTFGLRQLSELCAATQQAFDQDHDDPDNAFAMSRQLVQLAPTALTALTLYRRSRSYAGV
ncbi:response regulator [Thalassospira sp.]|uniref:response regulator n=1 Tax=Thalassospira sp. TaxID=1912094 RepID=UPI002734005C|nr:response regulator [Thalassospira sp.]MDP2696738.1 response regulator [Thalassospira sp.]